MDSFNLSNDKIIGNTELDLDKYEILEKKDGKFIKVSIILFSLIFCLIVLFCILFFILNNKKTEQKKEEEESTDIEKEKTVLLLPTDPNFKKYLDKFPSILKTTSDGKIEIETSAMQDDIPDNKLIFKEENSYSYKKVVIENQENSNQDASLDFSLKVDLTFYFDSKYNQKVKNVEQSSQKSTYIVVNYYLSSLAIKRENIPINEYFLKKIIKIANSDSSDADKAAKLIKIFSEFGYFIPLNIKIGGYFYKKIDNNESYKNYEKLLELESKLDSDEIKSNAEYKNLLNTFIKNFYSEENIYIVGGDINKLDIEEWKSSLNYGNAQIIEYNNLIKITDLLDDFLDDDIYDKLENPLKLVEKKYKNRELYYETLKKAKEYKTNDINISGRDSKRNGLCEKNELIYSVIFNIYEKKRLIDESFNDIIVGWKIISKWDDGTNGSYVLTNDPILTNKIKCEFESRAFRKQDFDLEVFLMKKRE